MSIWFKFYSMFSPGWLDKLFNVKYKFHKNKRNKSFWCQLIKANVKVFWCMCFYGQTCNFRLYLSVRLSVTVWLCVFDRKRYSFHDKWHSVVTACKDPLYEWFFVDSVHDKSNFIFFLLCLTEKCIIFQPHWLNVHIQPRLRVCFLCFSLYLMTYLLNDSFIIKDTTAHHISTNGFESD